MSSLRTAVLNFEVNANDGVTGIKQFTRAVSDADSVIDKINETMGDNVTVTYKTVKSTSELTAEARALVSQMERTNARVKEMTSLYQHQISLIGKTAQEQEVLNAMYKLGSAATQQQKQQLTDLIGVYQQLSELENVASKVRESVSAYEEKARALNRTANEQELYIALSKLGANATQLEIEAVRNAVIAYQNLAEANKSQQEAKRTEQAVESLIAEYARLNNMIGRTTAEQSALNAVYRLGSNATEEQKKKVAEVAYNYGLLAQKSQEASASFRGLRGVSQQLGWQLQDVIVQAQTGTSAFVILSQQGSQLASAFGPRGALIGAVIAVAGAIGGAFVNSMGVAGEEIDKLIGKVDSLGKATKELAAIELRKKIQDDQRRLVEIDSLSRIGFLQDKQRSGVELSERELKQLLELTSQREQLTDSITTQEGYLDTLTRSETENIEKSKKAREETEKLLKSYGLKTTLLGKTDREQAKINATTELGSDATDEQRKSVLAAIDTYYNEHDALKAREKAIKDAEKAEKAAAAESKRISQQRERSFQAETLSLIKQTETVDEEYSRRKAIIDDYVKHEGTDQRTDQAYAALEQWKTNALTEEYKKRESVRKQIEDAQRKQSGREDPTGFENDLFARNLKTLSDQKKLIGESELTERQRIDALIEAETERHVSRLGEITNTQLTGQLQNYATFTGALGNVFGQLQQMAEEGSKEAAALFYINQAIALADTIVNTELAATKTLSQLGVFGIPASTIIRATGYASAGIIAGQTIAGAYDKGGVIPAGQSGIVAEYGDELVNGVMVKGPARVTSREETAAMMNNGGGSVSILIENRIDGASYREERIDENTVKIIAEKVFNQNIDSGVSSVLGNRNSKSTKQLKTNFSVKGKY